MQSDRLAWLVDTTTQQRDQLANWLNASERAEFLYDWSFWARETQLAPPGNWFVWLVLAGRGFGKTRCGAEWVRRQAEADAHARIAIVGASLAEARSVMIEGESGIMTCSPPGRMPVYEPSLRRLRFPNGAQALLYSANEPESLRGPQHSHAWCDEIGKWPLAHDRATRCWDNLLMGLRLGQRQQAIVTTTPRAVPLVKRLLDSQASPHTVVTRGTTWDNAAYLPARFLGAMQREFGQSQLARQELEGELLDEIEGALWSRKLIESVRCGAGSPRLARVVVGVDPPASSTGDACGIVVVGRDDTGLAHVLADCSLERASPEAWARAVANACAAWSADRVVAEANQGGEMVASVLRAADLGMPLRLVRAARGKVARAEPVAALYEAGRVKHRGVFGALEDQLCGLMTGGEYLGPGNSPDRADALVWALSELMLGSRRAPRIMQV